MDMPVNVPVDDPNVDTEWNEILRKHKIIPEKPPSPTPIIQEAIEKARVQAHENRLQDKDLDELDALEDEEEEEFLQKYRNQRLVELSTITATSVYGHVYHLQKPDYSKDVTEASKKAFVFVHLTSSLGTNIESQLLTEVWRELAKTFGDVKFCEIKADMCIEGYPERNTPTILIYKDADIKRQVVTLREFGGQYTTTRDIENLLVALGAIEVNDQRLSKKDRDDPDQGLRTVRSGKILTTSAGNDELDDWD